MTTLRPGESAELAGYTVRARRLDEQVPGPNYVADHGRLHRHRRPTARRATPVAERRIYAASGMPTTEAAIETYGFSQLYLQLGEPAPMAPMSCASGTSRTSR